VPVLRVHGADGLGHHGIRSGVQRQHSTDLANPAAQRNRVEMPEVGVQGSFDLAEDRGCYHGLVQVGVERAEQQIRRQDRHEHVRVENRHRSRNSESGSVSRRLSVADHVLERLAPLGDHLVPVGP